MTSIVLDAFSLDLPFPQTLGDGADGRVGRGARGLVVLHALRQISLSLSGGSRVALFGQNGSGKSTLLRAMAGIYEPHAGSIRTEGRTVAMIDPGFGFYPELTVRDNIRLFCFHHRLSKTEIDRVTEDVVAFTNLGVFLPALVSSLSSGMTMRLGFALATAISPHIVLMDEWFFTADGPFLAKAATRLDATLGTSGILVMSSHLLSIAGEWCDTACWLESGKLMEYGPISTISAAYLKAA